MEEVSKDYSPYFLRREYCYSLARVLFHIMTLFQRNNKLVWEETCAIMNDLFDNVWGDNDSVSLDHCLEITLPVCPHLRQRHSELKR